MSKKFRNGAFHRSQRIKKVAREIAKRLHSGKKINLEGFISWIELEIGLTPKKAREYIDLTCKTHNWHINGGSIIKDVEEEA